MCEVFLCQFLDGILMYYYINILAVRGSTSVDDEERENSHEWQVYSVVERGRGEVEKKRTFFHDHSLGHDPFQITELSKSGMLGRKGIMESVAMVLLSTVQKEK